MAIEYFNFLGTEDMSPAKKKEEFYKLGGKRDEIFKKLHLDTRSILSKIKN